VSVELVYLSYDFSSCLVLVFMNCGRKTSPFVIEHYSINNNFVRALTRTLMGIGEKDICRERKSKPCS
jgi:hypothetical protein